MTDRETSTCLIGREWDSIMGRRKIVAIRTMGGCDVAIVQTGERRIGCEIVSTVDLPELISFETRQYSSRQRSRAAAESEQAARAAVRREGMSLDGFEDALTPRMRSIAIRVLTGKGITSEGALYGSIRDLVRDRVRTGWKVDAETRRFVGPEGQFLTESDISKIGMDYAAHLTTVFGSATTDV